MTYWQRAIALGNGRSKFVRSSPVKKFTPPKRRKNEVYLEIKETTMCVGSSNEKETVTLDNRCRWGRIYCYDGSFHTGYGRLVEKDGVER